MTFRDGSHHFDVDWLKGLARDDPTIVKPALGSSFTRRQKGPVGTIEHEHRLFEGLELIQQVVDPFQAEINSYDANQFSFFIPHDL